MSSSLVKKETRRQAIRSKACLRNAPMGKSSASRPKGSASDEAISLTPMIMSVANAKNGTVNQDFKRAGINAMTKMLHTQVKLIKW
eukprot:CAMPEP_0170637378 /NCGR_PEP_ID=MMETSP0224-20130122/38373_1 /TAXON_ID=285029 /ORGANISM="Togula jolla, Strain CCCM 725" /LENGTH=85 /DNA_ID=CAMNT_0010967241 /DNA_START=382 /DNA_END=639 /DNA_ORIENTATION=-